MAAIAAGAPRAHAEIHRSPRTGWVFNRSGIHVRDLTSSVDGVLILFTSLALAYAGSYYRLSRRGMREAREYGLPGSFLYVPWAEFTASGGFTRHYGLAIFYAPPNWIDRAIFGGPSPLRVAARSIAGAGRGPASVTPAARKTSRRS
jgi:hypothetical protein